MLWMCFEEKEEQLGLRVWKRCWDDDDVMIADSCFIIDLMRKDQTALEKLSELKEINQLQYITSPTVMELAVGIELAALPKNEQKRVDQILAGFQILSLDTTSAWRAGIEIGRLRKKGVAIDPIDGQIAGIALCHDEIIVTRNVRHFQYFEELKIERY
jgi:tRNA(fMet)-specific endonuclease VapC